MGAIGGTVGERLESGWSRWGNCDEVAHGRAVVAKCGKSRRGRGSAGQRVGLRRGDILKLFFNPNRAERARGEGEQVKEKLYGGCF